MSLTGREIKSSSSHRKESLLSQVKTPSQGWTSFWRTCDDDNDDDENDDDDGSDKARYHDDDDDDEEEDDEEEEELPSPDALVACRPDIQSYESMIDYVEGVGETVDNMTRCDDNDNNHRGLSILFLFLFVFLGRERDVSLFAAPPVCCRCRRTTLMAWKDFKITNS